MPKAIRTDNGSPLGAPSRAVIPIMSLWLAGWGIRHILNRPRRPTDNPNVENNQNTSARWAEVYKCKDLREVADKLDEVSGHQRDNFRVSRLGKRTRKESFPKLYKNERRFEQAHFDVQKAYQLLAKGLYPRKVSANGVVAIYDKAFSIAAKYRGKIVFLTFDPEKVAWICTDEQKQILKVLPDDRFSEQNLYNLDICQ